MYEVYIIQSLDRKTLAPKGEAFFRLGYQLYNLDYTGSNNWIGYPVKISDPSASDPSNAQMLSQLRKATDIYVAFDVRF